MLTTPFPFQIDKETFQGFSVVMLVPLTAVHKVSKAVQAEYARLRSQMSNGMASEEAGSAGTGLNDGGGRGGTATDRVMGGASSDFGVMVGALPPTLEQ